MKRRLTVTLLAVFVCIVGAYQTGLYPASGQTPTPTSGALGSISGRVYVDVDANGSFGGPDAPLVFPIDLFNLDVGGLPATTNSSIDGSYQFSDLPAGNYQLSINLPVFSCAVPLQPFSWVGDPFGGNGCVNFDLTTSEKEVALAPGEGAIGIDFPQLPRSYDISARIWVDGQPLSPQNIAVVAVGGHPCWSAQITRAVTAAQITISLYSAKLTPLADPACAGGDLDILVDGRAMGASTSWNEFWKNSLFPFGPRPLNPPRGVAPFLQSTDLAAPPFLAITGGVAEAGTVTPPNVSRHQEMLVPDGTEIKAFVGAALCGTTVTKTLTGPQGQFGGNLLGLIVQPATVKPGCGTAGALVTFCIGDFKARQPAAGPFSYFQSPEPKTVQWAAPALVDITLEPTNDPCLATEAPQLPVSLPQTGGPPR